MKKGLVSAVLAVLVVLSSFAVAEDNCAGFWGSVRCFLWGDPMNRAGMGWFDRGNLAEEEKVW